MRLRSKINLYTSVMFILLLILINSAIYYSFSQLILERELERSAAEAELAVRGIHEGGSSIPVGDLLRAYRPVSGMITVISKNGKSDIAITDPENKGLLNRKTKFFQQEDGRIIQFEGTPHSFVSIPIITTTGEIANLQMTESLQSVAHTLYTLRWVLVAMTVIAAIPVLLSSRILSNLILKPISSMIKTMLDIRRSGEYKQIPLTKQSKDELYQMGQAFNEMIDQLDINNQKQEQFVSNASHELRTPLTIIESYASLLKRRGLQQPELFEEAVEAIHSESIRMRELTQQLLVLARQEELGKVELKQVHLLKLVEEAIRSFHIAYGREIQLNTIEDVHVQADEQRLKQLIYIFMENAHKYSDDGITVTIRSEKGKGILEIKDRGIGIPAEELPKVFDRFYRVDKARTRKGGGFGLGLPLAKEIATSIHAEVGLMSIEGEGTTAKINMQVVEPSEC